MSGTDTDGLLDRLQRELADQPAFVLGQIEAYARDDLCDPCLSPRQRLTEIVRLINAWDTARQRVTHAHR